MRFPAGKTVGRIETPATTGRIRLKYAILWNFEDCTTLNI
jgi:hypothetical protein